MAAHTDEFASWLHARAWLRARVHVWGGRELTLRARRRANWTCDWCAPHRSTCMPPTPHAVLHLIRTIDWGDVPVRLARVPFLVLVC